MSLTRRGFIGALATLFAAPSILAKIEWPEAVAAAPAFTAANYCSWSNIQTAAPMTAKSLQEAIMLLETMPVYYSGATPLAAFRWRA